MANFIKSDEFVDICYECEFDVPTIRETLIKLRPGYTVKPHQIRQRIANYRRKGLLPLDSGNTVSSGEILKSSSTLYDKHGNVKLQWVKSDVAKEDYLAAFSSAISEIAAKVPVIPTIESPKTTDIEAATLYISNDVHIGSLIWDKETGEDYDTEIANQRLRDAYDYLFSISPNTKIGIVVDLGDLMEVDNDKNMTPKSGNILSVDSRYPKILRTANDALIYAVNKALQKHEEVYFYNIVGNHDMNSGLAVMEVMRIAFADNTRVHIDDLPSAVKYHHYGKVLLQFSHGDGLKMRQAGEAMAVDCEDIFSSTKYRYAHSGHTHKDAVIDTPICRAESHRNIAPLNNWAFHKGYRRQPGTMKSITYDPHRGEISRNLFTL